MDMKDIEQNYYGSLCTLMYEALHETAPNDELEFYLSYARPDENILEAMCGSGRFLVPMLDRGFKIIGTDKSPQMLAKLKDKAHQAQVIEADILEFESSEHFDYIFISSGSVSLFTDLNLCKQVLLKMKSLLAPQGKLVFAVDTIANQCADDEDYKLIATADLENGQKLTLKSKNTFDVATQTQFSPGIYELFANDGALLQKEHMDFQTHLYRCGEMEQILTELGFKTIRTYSSFDKDTSISNQSEMFLFECCID